MFAFFSVMFVVLAMATIASASEMVEVSSVSSYSYEVGGLSVGVESVSYGSVYYTPGDVETPKRGDGFVFGDFGPGGWKVSVTQTSAESQDGGVKTLVDDDNLLLTIYPGEGPFGIGSIDKVVFSKYKVTTIEFFRFINLIKQEKKLMVPATVFVDLGVGGGVIHTNGTITETYDYGYWEPYVVNPHHLNSEQTVSDDRMFGNIGVQLGVKTEHVALTVGASTVLGLGVAGFSPGITVRTDLGIRW